MEPFEEQGEFNLQNVCGLGLGGYWRRPASDKTFSQPDEKKGSGSVAWGGSGLSETRTPIECFPPAHQSYPCNLGFTIGGRISPQRVTGPRRTGGNPGDNCLKSGSEMTFNETAGAMRD